MTTESDYRTLLKGVTDSRYPGKVAHYRGIQYATISQRFAKPILNERWSEKKKEFIKFGPRCPQPPCDIRKFMQIPKHLPTHDVEQEDELACANLNVTCPSDTSLSGLPVLLWIYGGSQVNTFGSAAQKIGDTGPLVAQSIDQQKPIMLITINYRLNFFAFGTTEGEINLDLQDQRVAIQWIKQYISDFGGDPENITLGGESAGAIYVHALLASGTNSVVQRGILASGNLYTVPPQPDKRCLGLIGVAEGNLALMEMEQGNMNPGEAVTATLAGAPVDRIVKTLKDLEIGSMWMSPEPGLQGWQNDEEVFGKLKGLLISDCEFESSEDAELINRLPVAKIVDAFNVKDNAAGLDLAKAYGVNGFDQEQSQKGALNFINDAYYAYPQHVIAQRIRKSSGKVYQYYFDQPNPFTSPSLARAHHAVDLFAVFGGYDGFIGDEMKEIGQDLRTKWINFVNGEAPWKEEEVWAFGPNGKSEGLNSTEAASRRRMQQFEALKLAGLTVDHEIRLRLQAALGTS